MKKIYTILAAAAALASFAACTKELTKELPSSTLEKEAIGQDGFTFDAGGNYCINFEAGLPGTKTVFYENTIRWGAGDEALFFQHAYVGGEEKRVSIYNNALSADKDVLSVNITSFNTPDEGTVATYTSVYPRSAYKAYITGYGIRYVRLEIPTDQTPTATAYDPAADLLIGEYIQPQEVPTTVKFAYKRMTGINKMTISGLTSTEKIASVSFSAVQGGNMAILTGSQTFDLQEGVVSEKVQSANNAPAYEVNLNYAAENIAANAGLTAYFMTYPYALAAGDSFTVKVKTADGKTLRKDVTIPADRSLVLEANHGAQFTVDMTNAVEEKGTFVNVKAASATYNKVTMATEAHFETAGDYVMGIAPKAAYFDGEKVDTTALVTYALANGETAEGSTQKTYSAMNSLTYLCYAVIADGKGGAESISIKETKTADAPFAITNDVNFATADYISFKPQLRYTVSRSSSTGAVKYYTPYTNITYVYSNPKSAKLAAAKYALFTLSAFVNKFGGTDAAAVYDNVVAYFEESGSTVSANNIANINAKATAAYSGSFINLSEGTIYVLICWAQTEEGEDMISAYSIRTFNSAEEWIHVTNPEALDFNIKSDFKCSAGAYTASYSTSATGGNSQYANLYNYDWSTKSQMSDARVAALSTEAGCTISYTPTASRSYTFSTKVTNICGDSIIRAIPACTWE